MKLAIDVQYEGDTAVVAGILFTEWSSEIYTSSIIKMVENILPYEPGSFYKRELPCILALLDEVTDNLDVIVIDGFVTLGKDSRDGLGMRLYKSLNQSIPVVGVAKKAFSETPKECEVYRGGSHKPLYVTSVGIHLAEAKNHIAAMHGKYRNPTLLKRVDQLCRGINID